MSEGPEPCTFILKPIFLSLSPILLKVFFQVNVHDYDRCTKQYVHIKINLVKSKSMMLSREQIRHGLNMPTVRNKQIEKVSCFKYISILVPKQNSIPNEINERVATESSATFTLQNVFKLRLSVKHKK